MKRELETILHSVATGDISIDAGTLKIEGLFAEQQIGRQSTIFDPITQHENHIGKFSGSDYKPSIDKTRLEKQYVVIRNLMADGRFRTLQEIETKTGYPQASISAQLRNLRKESFGGHTIEKQRRGDVSNGLFEYRLRYYNDLEVVNTPKGVGTFIHYNEYDSTECQVDINGVWISFDLKQLTKYSDAKQ